MNPRSYRAWGLAVASGLVFTRLSLISFLVFTYLLSEYLLAPTKNKIKTLVWAYLLTSIFIGMIYMAAWLIDIKITATNILVILAVICWLLTIRNRNHPAAKKMKSKSLISVGAALAVCIFVSLPLLRDFSAPTTLRYAAKTGDDINHIAIIEANRQAEGYLYSEPEKHSGIIKPSYISYPQGWHINGAFLESLILKLIGEDSLAARLSSYLLYKLIWLFIAVFFVCELLFAITMFMLPQKSKYKNAAVGISGLALSLIFLVPLFGYGFQSYIANLGMLSAALVLAVEFFNAASQDRKKIYLLFMGGLMAGSSYAWLLSGVTVGLLIVAVLAIELANKKQKLKTWGLWLWATLLGLGAMAGLQAYIQLKYGSSAGISSINLGGVIPYISPIGVLSLLGVTLLITVWRKPKQSLWLPIILLVASVEYLGLALYQYIALGEQRYYATKLAYSVALLSSIVLLATVWAKLSTLKLSETFKFAAFLVLVAVLPFMLGLNMRKSAYSLKDGTPIKSDTARYLLRLPDKSNNLVVRTSSEEESFLATKLLSSAWSYSSPTREKLLDQLDWEITH